MHYVKVTLSVEREGKHYVSRCSELGTVSCGHTREEALQNIIEATELYLNTLEDLGQCAEVLKGKGLRIHAKKRAERGAASPLDVGLYSGEIPLQAACPSASGCSF